MTNSSVQSIASSNSNILVTSDPSIQSYKRNSKLLNGALIVLVCVSLIGLALSIFFSLQKIDQNVEAVDQIEAAANAVKHITPTVVTKKNVVDVEDEEDNTILEFTLRSTPAGADVYKDGVFIGRTPIEDKKMKKSSEPVQFVISMNGYEIERKSITFDDNYSGSDLINLKKEVVVRQAVNNSAEPAAKDNHAVMANDAVVITTQSDKSTHHKNKKDKASGAAPVDTGIVLPQ